MSVSVLSVLKVIATVTTTCCTMTRQMLSCRGRNGRNRRWAASWALAAAAAMVGGLGALLAQQPTSSDPAVPPTDLKTLALVGCVVRGQEGEPLKLSDGFGGSVELKGGDLSGFVGKKVRVVGAGDSKRLTFRFGLYPSPNIAAQAGGINPIRAAEAAMPGGAAHGTGQVSLPELRVKIIRTMPGTCP